MLHGSSKPGKRSFGRFSRPLLEVYFQTSFRYEPKVKSLAVAEIFRYCKGFRLSYSYFCLLDQKYKRGLFNQIFSAISKSSQCRKLRELVRVSGGKTLCSCERHTTGEPVALALSLDTADVTANGKDYAIFTCYAVDKDGNRVPDATPLVTFSASGCAKVFSTGSDNADHETLFSPTRRMYSGAISVAVSVSDNGKPLLLSATDVNGSLASAYFTADLTEKE